MPERSAPGSLRRVARRAAQAPAALRDGAARWLTLSEQGFSRIGREEITRLLVVDDNADVRFAMYEFLSAEGFDVAVSADGIDALSLARLMRPQAVLLDIGMPAFDGYSTARAMRRIDWFSDVAIIAVTGFFDAEHVDNARAAGFDFYFQKPVEIDALLSLLDGYTGNKQA